MTLAPLSAKVSPPNYCRRHPLVVAAAFGFALAVAGCVSSGSQPGPPITAPPSAAQSVIKASVAPAGSKHTTLSGSALLTTPAGATLTLHSSRSDQVDVYVAPSGALSFQMALAGAHNTDFDISGGASTGAAQTGERVSLLGPLGLYLDTTQASTGTCSTTFSAASATDIAGTTVCTLIASQTQVTVHFRAA